MCKKIGTKNFVFDSNVIKDEFKVVKLLYLKARINKKGFPRKFGFAESFVINACHFCEICLRVLFCLREVKLYVHMIYLNCLKC